MLRDVALRMLIALQHVELRARDEHGQTIAEYGLIVTMIAVVTIITAVTFFRDEIIASFNAATGCLDGSC